jgi:peptide chain release factor subunit 1
MTTGIDLDLEILRTKKLIKHLESARGNHTSMVSLLIKSGDQLNLVNQMLLNELGTASNIKSRVNRLSVLGAINSVKEKLKLYPRLPPNGLCIFSGNLSTDDAVKEKQVTVDFEPYKPLRTSLYLCDSVFHTEELYYLLQSDKTYGYIVVDGNGCLYGTLAGNNKITLGSIGVDLPKKHNKGGQSANRFARLRLEARHNYVTKCCELATKYFISNDVPNINGLILAGSADFKDVIQKSDLFDYRLRPIVLGSVDINYGGESGFSQAISLSESIIGNMKINEEKKVLTDLFNEIAQDTNKYSIGIQDTIMALEAGAVEKLIVFEDTVINRYTFVDTERVLYSSEEIHEYVEKINFVDWLAEHYKEFGTELKLVSTNTHEGVQFVNGFGGVAGLLRWPMNFTEYEDYDEDA